MHPPPRPRAAGKSKTLEGKAYVVGQICLPLIGIGLITNLPNYDEDQSSRPHTFRRHCAPCLVEKMAYISHGSNAWLYKRASKSFHVMKKLLSHSDAIGLHYISRFSQISKLTTLHGQFPRKFCEDFH